MHCTKCLNRNATQLHRTFRKQMRSWKRCLNSSTEITEKAPNEISYHICENDPTQHTMEDYSKLYIIPNNEVQGRLQHAVPLQFKEFSDIVRETGIILRKPTLSILKTFQESKLHPSPKFLLYGPVGSGKSLSLLHIIQYCLLKDWVVLHVPNGFHFIDRQGRTRIQESQWRTARVDQPEEAMLWLNQFRNMNPKFLEETKTTQVYKWGKRETTDKDQPLLHVVEQGVGRSMFSTDAVGVILKEIQQNTSLNVLYAVDGFNSFFGKTSHKLNGRLVNLEELSLIRQFTKLLKPEYSLPNGAFVMAMSQSSHYLDKKAGYEVNEILPDEVLHGLGEYTEVEVPYYNDQEYQTMMKYYREKRWMAKELTDSLLQQVKFMTAADPTLVRKFCANM